jgi:hypothetical protein
MKSVVLKSAVLASLIMPTVLGSTTALADEDYSRNYQSGGMVQFTPDNQPTDPVDPENPDPENPVKPWDPTSPDHKPNPGTEGPLSLDFASSLDFGNNKITNKDAVYYAEPQYLWNAEENDFDPATARPNYVQVTDKRGTNAGWSLTLQQQGQFKNEQTLNKELTGAAISFTSGEAASSMKGVKAPKTFDMLDLVPGETVKVMAAEKNAGAGTWVDRFGKIETVDVEGKKVAKNTAITLFVPGSTPKDAVKYETKLLWTLTDVPENS